MDKKWLEQQVKELKLEESIRIEEIPNLDLYMDQIITLFEDKLSHTKRYEDDKLLTKTMINNYTKDKVIMPTVKKKYTKDHIMLMILLYQFKSIVSIGDIKDLFSVLKEDGDINSKKLKSLYQGYLNAKEKEQGYFELGIGKRVDMINEQMKNLEEDEELEEALLVCTLIEQANYHKRLAEKIIDTRLKTRDHSS